MTDKGKLHKVAYDALLETIDINIELRPSKFVDENKKEFYDCLKNISIKKNSLK